MQIRAPNGATGAISDKLLASFGGRSTVRTSLHTTNSTFSMAHSGAGPDLVIDD